MENLLHQILQEIQEIKKEQHNMRTDLTDIKTEQQNMRTELTGIKTEQTNSKQQIQNMNESINIGFAHLNNRIDRLEGKIESEIIDKIRSLYDARELIIDNLTEFREEFNDTMEEIIKRDFDKTVKLNKIEKIINLKNVK